MSLRRKQLLSQVSYDKSPENRIVSISRNMSHTCFRRLATVRLCTIHGETFVARQKLLRVWWPLGHLRFRSRFFIQTVALCITQHNANVNVVDVWKFTPLHEAAAKGKYHICKLLLKVHNYSNSNTALTLVLRGSLELMSIVRTETI